MIDAILQTIVLSWMRILIVALGFSITWRLTRMFDLGYAASITLGPYFAYSLSNSLGVHPLPSCILAVAACAVFGFTANEFVFSKLRARAAAPSSGLLASLGIYVAMQNGVSLLWGDATLVLPFQNLSTQSASSGLQAVRPVVWVTIFSGVVLASVFHALLVHTRFGLRIRSSANSRPLAIALGIPVGIVIGQAWMLSYGVGALAGILIAWDLNAVPTMGLPVLLPSVIASLLGSQSVPRTAVVALAIAVVGQAGAWFFGVAWAEVVTYIVICAALLFRRLPRPKTVPRPLSVGGQN